MNDYAMLGEKAIAPATALGEYPAKLSAEEGAAVWMQYLTAYGALVAIAHLAKGDSVAITAASSSVGIAAIEIAKAEGAISIATTRKSNKKAELLSLGADHAIATEEEDMVARVKEITGGKGARVIFDPGCRAICGKAGRGCCARRDHLSVWFAFDAAHPLSAVRGAG
jgi:NADPH:quinone reductase-like Zn-dependent oxidoreductase